MPGEALDARHIALRRDAETAEIGGGAVDVRRATVPFPQDPAARQRPAGGVQRKIAAHALRHRQMGHEIAQRSELQPIELDEAGRCGVARRFPQRHLEIGRLEALPFGGDKRQRLCIEFAPRQRDARANATRQARKLEIRQIWPKFGLHVGELEIGNDVVRLAVCKIEPQSQRALAARDRYWHRQPFGRCRDVRVVEPDVDLPRRMLPVALRPAAHITAHVDRRRKLGRRRSEQPEPMAAKAALEPESARGRGRAAAHCAGRRST